MKAIIVLATLLLSFTSLATTIQINGHDQIRHGAYFSINPTFTSFSDEVGEQLAQRADVKIVEANAEFIVNYQSSISQDTYNDLFPQGTVSAKIYGPRSYYRFVTFACYFDVNDGGNVTLRVSCAKKLARKVAKILRQHSRLHSRP